MSFMRNNPLITGEFYHIFNRGVARMPTFISTKDYNQALLALNFYRYTKPGIPLSRFKVLSAAEKQKTLDKLTGSKKLVEIIAFVFMPNHFHFLLKQTQDKGITRFLSQFTNSYTRYINTISGRIGPLFQGVFKSVLVESDEQLLHLSRYIHLNPFVSNLISEKNLSQYRWSSFIDFQKGQSPLVSLDPILHHFKNPSDYQKFVFDHLDYAKKLNEIKHLLHENNS